MTLDRAVISLISKHSSLSGVAIRALIFVYEDPTVVHSKAALSRVRVGDGQRAAGRRLAALSRALSCHVNTMDKVVSSLVTKGLVAYTGGKVRPVNIISML